MECNAGNAAVEESWKSNRRLFPTIRMLPLTVCNAGKMERYTKRVLSITRSPPISVRYGNAPGR
jgi:hypothetical protein